MEESAEDVVKRLMKQGLRFSSLRASYYGLPIWRRVQVVKKHGSFIDWLTSAFETESEESLDFTSAIQREIGIRVLSKMISIETLPVSETMKKVIKAPGLVSEEGLKEILRRLPEFEIIAGASGDELRFAKKKSQKSPKVFASSSFDEEEEIPFNILSTGVHWQDLRRTCAAMVRKHPERVKKYIDAHGCFLRFLVAYAHVRVRGFSVKDYTLALQKKLTKAVLREIAVCGSMTMKLDELMDSINSEGCLVDRDFFAETEKAFMSCFRIRDGWVTLLSSKHPSKHKSSSEVARDSPRNLADASLPLHVRISQILSSHVPPGELFWKVLHLFRSLPAGALADVLDENNSYWSFIVARVTNWTMLHASIPDVVKTHLGTRTETTPHLVKSICGAGTPLISPEQLAAMLKDAKDFVVLDYLPGVHLVCMKRTSSETLAPVTLSDTEKRTALFLLSLFGDKHSTLPLNAVFATAYQSTLLNGDMRRLLFGGDSDATSPEHATTSFVYFRRFLLMFPQVFCVIKNASVSVMKGAAVELASTSKAPARREEIAPEPERADATRDRASSQPLGVSERRRKKDREFDPQPEVYKSQSGRKKRRHKRPKSKRRRRWKCVSRSDLSREVARRDHRPAGLPDSGIEDSVLSDELSAIPDSLIQRVSMGRLLGSSSGEMDIDSLVKSLIDVVICNETSKKNVKDNRIMFRAFRSKVLDVLKRVDKVHLLKPDQTGFCRKVKLVLTPPASVDPKGDAPLAVFRRISRVTRVSNSKMINYIFSVASLSRKPLPLHILHTLVRQKFASRKVLPKISNDLLQCQVLSCLKSSSKFVLNPEEQTFCLSNDCGQMPPTKSSQYGVQEKELTQCIVDCLQATPGTGQLDTEVIADMVHCQLKHRFEDLQKPSATLMVESLFAEIPQVGFTLDGKVALLPDETESLTSSSSSEDESEESSLENEPSPLKVADEEIDVDKQQEGFVEAATAPNREKMEPLVDATTTGCFGVQRSFVDQSSLTRKRQLSSTSLPKKSLLTASDNSDAPACEVLTTDGMANKTRATSSASTKSRCSSISSSNGRLGLDRTIVCSPSTSTSRRSDPTARSLSQCSVSDQEVSIKVKSGNISYNTKPFIIIDSSPSPKEETEMVISEDLKASCASSSREFSVFSVRKSISSEASASRKRKLDPPSDFLSSQSRADAAKPQIPDVSGLSRNITHDVIVISSSDSTWSGVSDPDLHQSIVCSPASCASGDSRPAKEPLSPRKRTIDQDKNAEVNSEELSYNPEFFVPIGTSPKGDEFVCSASSSAGDSRHAKKLLSPKKPEIDLDKNAEVNSENLSYDPELFVPIDVPLWSTEETEADVCEAAAASRRRSSREFSGASVGKSINSATSVSKKRKSNHPSCCERRKDEACSSGLVRSADATDERRLAHRQRRIKMQECATAYLVEHSCSVATALLVVDLYEKFSGEEFAKNKLAFEACILDFLTAPGSQFALGNQTGGPGASWVFYKPEGRGMKFNKAISLPHAELLPEIVNLCNSHLSQPKRGEEIDVLTDLVSDKLRSGLSHIQSNELKFLFRCLILVGCLRDKMKRFYFSKTAPVLYLRPVDTTPLTSPGPQPSSSRARGHSETKVQPGKVKAVDAIADLIRRRGPLTKTDLRDIWSAEASKEAVKVIGTGVSFTLAFREFEKCFPTSADGTLTVNESMLEQFKQQRKHK